MPPAWRWPARCTGCADFLGHKEAVHRQEGLLSLDVRFCWVDVWAVERLLGHAEAPLGQQDNVRKAADLYRGSFLGGRESDLPQATALADRLRRQLLRQIVQIGRQCEQADDRQEAADWYEEGLRVDPCAEDLCRSLMTAYHRLGRSAAVSDVYRRCRRRPCPSRRGPCGGNTGAVRGPPAHLVSRLRSSVPTPPALSAPGGVAPPRNIPDIPASARLARNAIARRNRHRTSETRH